ncbi:type I 3-dehydroquinate dehydratase [Halocatena halophila]|uniref:type I 3-dehydroquinate dehydratase n=1 Tax=Halocatena halophila TaxID=2814576 RepID=UPI002ED44034
MEFDSFVLVAATDSLHSVDGARQHADAIEFRMDLSETPRKQLESYDGELPILATNRWTAEGGTAEDDADRLAMLEWAIEQPAVAAIDVEFGALDDPDWRSLVADARAGGVRVVVSLHDFDRTPSKAVMNEQLHEAGKHGDCAKLAVTATDRRDVLDLLSVTETRTAAGETVATMAMGAVGQHSRAVAPLYGSRIGYAPVAPDDATAPGQYTLETLSQLVRALSVDH